MNHYNKPSRWSEAANKLFPHQVGFTAPPHDFDAAPSDFLRISPETVGVHGRMLHVPQYTHQLTQRRDNFHLLEEVAHCMANNGADVIAQVGTNWVHCNGTDPSTIQRFCAHLSERYQTPFHMAGMCLVEALHEMGAERIALNSVYYWPDWRDGIARFLRQAGFQLDYVGNFVDQGLYPNQQVCNQQTWIFPTGMAQESMQRVAESAPDVDAYVVNGMPNFRRHDGLPQRMLSLEVELENLVGKPIIASDTALYWRILKTLELAPTTQQGALLSRLS